jgi:hypothetical protein
MIFFFAFSEGFALQHGIPSPPSKVCKIFNPDNLGSDLRRTFHAISFKSRRLGGAEPSFLLR